METGKDGSKRGDPIPPEKRGGSTAEATEHAEGEERRGRGRRI